MRQIQASGDEKDTQHKVWW